MTTHHLIEMFLIVGIAVIVAGALSVFWLIRSGVPVSRDELNNYWEDRQ